jgi:Predicted membrane protein
MAKCNKCGADVADNIKFCPSCGNNMTVNQQNSQNFNQTVQNLNNTSDYTNSFDKADIEQNKAMALLSYLGILFIIPLLAAPNSKFARFHANQGLVLFIAEIAISIVSGILTGILWFLGSLIASLCGLIIFIFAILGIVNAVGGKAKELPLIGGIKLIK